MNTVLIVIAESENQPSDDFFKLLTAYRWAALFYESQSLFQMQSSHSSRQNIEVLRYLQLEI